MTAPSTIFPVDISLGIWPPINTIPAPFVPCDTGEVEAGALSVLIISIIQLSKIYEKTSLTLIVVVNSLKPRAPPSLPNPASLKPPVGAWAP